MLYRCNIHNAKYIHRNTDITHTVLYRYNIHHDEFIHWNTNISSTALRRCDIRNDKCTHCNIDTIPTAICIIVSFVCKQIVCYGIAFLSILLFNP